MQLSADRLDVTKGERIRATLVGSTWTVGATPHTANALEDVGFRVLSLVDTLPLEPDWRPGKIDPPGFPNTLLWAELEPKETASLRLDLTEDLTVARAWLAPSSSSSASSPSARPLHPYDAIGGEPAIVEGRVVAFRVAYATEREAAA